MQRVGIMGDEGSACEQALPHILSACAVCGPFEIAYLISAEEVLNALEEQAIDFGLLAEQSPLGADIAEAAAALARHCSTTSVGSYIGEVEHRLFIKVNDDPESVHYVASHCVALEKHRGFLDKRFPGWKEIETADSGLAAKSLAAGLLPPGTAVICMAGALRLGLQMLPDDLPANRGYKTKFVLYRRKNDV